MLAAIQYPNVTNLLEVGQIDQTWFLVMEFVNGLDLKNVLEREPQLGERLALEITRDIASALAAAHQQNIIHRDLKPAHILLSAEQTVKFKRCWLNGA